MYETGTATSISDLLSKLGTFAGTAGWTVDQSTSTILALTRSGVSVQLQCAASSPTCVGIYQSTAFINTSTAPGQHTNDSGQGFVGTINDTNLLTGRNCLLPNSTMTYWAFEDDNYLHVVVEAATQQFRHFGFGALTKSGSWTGGEYSYGWRNNSSGNTNLGDAETISHLLDGLAGSATAATQRPFMGTVHIESLPNQTASGKWGLTWAGGLANTGTDRGGTARENLQGGFRGGPVARGFGRFGGATGNGLVPMYPIGVWYDDRANARWYELGWMKDVRGFNVKNFSGGDEVLVGSDTWLVFPAKYKLSVSANGGTFNLGMAYKKVTT